MHLGLDLLFLVPERSGGRETYARELLTHIRAARPGLRVTTFVNAETARHGGGFWTDQADRTVLLPRAAAGRRGAWALGEVVGLPRAAARAGVDILHSPANFGPWSGPFARVLTVHDMAHRDVPGATGRVAGWGTELLMRPAMARAHRILTGSADAAATLRARGVAGDRIDVVHHGVAPPPPSPVGREAARSAIGLDEERIVALVVATHLPHKNLPGLLAGLAAVPAASRPLLLVAGHGTDAPELAAHVAANGIEEDVRLLGAQSAVDLEGLFAAADVLVTATLQEGFGLTVVEGMARGLAVAASDLPVLREVAGDEGAVWFDPRSPHSIAEALGRMVTEPASRARLGGRGPARAARYTWAASAAATLGAYDHALVTRAIATAAGCPPEPYD